MSIHRVVLVGADGKLGPTILQHLVSAGFAVTVLKRTSSKSPSDYPSSVTVQRVLDDFGHDALLPVLQGQDAIVVTTAGSQVDVQRKLAAAGAEAGVKRFIQADFGSCDSSSARAQELVPLFKQKSDLRGFLTQLARENQHFTWSALVVGHFFDWSMDFLHIHVKERRAEILDGGDVKFSITSLAQVARATVAVLQKAEVTANRVMFVQSCNLTQREIIESSERATRSTWKVKDLESKSYIEEKRAKAADGDHEAIEDLVWVLGTIEGDWSGRDAFAMKLLGLHDENVDDIVHRIVKDQG